MPLAEGLLAVARDLTVLDAGKPRQASLRRAVSTAYYALFHLLVQAAVQRLLANQAERREYGVLFSRSFTHTAVRTIAHQLQAPPAGRPNDLRELFPAAISGDLERLCRAFVAAQAAREAADYDLAAVHQRSRVSQLINQVEEAFGAWSRVAGTDEGRRFTLAMILVARNRRA